MLNGAPLCDIKKRDKILKKFMMVKIAACRHIHFRLCRRADGRRWNSGNESGGKHNRRLL